MKENTRDIDVSLLVLDDDAPVHAYADEMFANNKPLGVISTRYSAVVPFMIGNRGRTVALIADVDDPNQLAEAIAIVERRLGHVTSLIRHRTDLPPSSAPTAA